MIPQQQLLESRGADLVTRDGDKAGKVEEIYLDRETDKPEWALVNTGLFGTRSTFFPLAEATAEGDAVVVPYGKDQIKGAPNLEPTGELSQREEADLYAYYGLAYSASSSDTGLPENGRESDGYDVSGPTTDTAMTRSEEELRVGKSRRERGRARLKKYVVTDQVTQTVPLRHEEVRIEREPITDANIDRALAGPDISEEEHEVVLHAEEPVVEKRAVAKERVRLAKDQVTEEQQISEELRKEQIQQEGDIRSN